MKLKKWFIPGAGLISHMFCKEPSDSNQVRYYPTLGRVGYLLTYKDARLLYKKLSVAMASIFFITVLTPYFFGIFSLLTAPFLIWLWIVIANSIPTGATAIPPYPVGKSMLLRLRYAHNVNKAPWPDHLFSFLTCAVFLFFSVKFYREGYAKTEMLVGGILFGSGAIMYTLMFIIFLLLRFKVIQLPPDVQHSEWPEPFDFESKR